MKQLLKSKTVRIAIIQAIISVLLVVFTELDLVGYIGIIKSVSDVYIRSITNSPISDK